MKYRSYAHHDKENGYQNVETAKEFAKFVKNQLARRKSVELIAVDGSSTFLAAFVKMLKPDWNLITGDKGTERIKGDFEFCKNLVFVDDYFCSGNATKAVIKMIENYLSEANHPENIYFYYIAGQNNINCRHADITNESKLKSKLHFLAME